MQEQAARSCVKRAAVDLAAVALCIDWLVAGRQVGVF